MTIIVPSKRYFVYTLARPDGRVFYVGMGSGRRPYDHESEARRPTCKCRKCEIIRRTWRSGRDIAIAYLYETDNKREALDRERQAIDELSRVYLLCNYFFFPRIPAPPKPLAEMNLGEMTAYLDWIDTPSKERQAKLREWALIRTEWVRRRMIHWRLRRMGDKLAEGTQELDILASIIGDAYQHSLFEK